MPRRIFGGTGGEVVLDPAGEPIPGATMTVWTAREGGFQVTDLLGIDEAPIPGGNLTADDTGAVEFYGPPDDPAELYLEIGRPRRFRVVPQDLGGRVLQLETDLRDGNIGGGLDAAGARTAIETAPALDLPTVTTKDGNVLVTLPPATPPGSVLVVGAGGVVNPALAFRFPRPDADGVIWVVDEDGTPQGLTTVDTVDGGGGPGGDDGSAWATKVVYAWDETGMPAEPLASPWTAAVGGVPLQVSALANQSVRIDDAFGPGKHGISVNNDYCMNGVETDPTKAVIIDHAPASGLTVYSWVIKDLFTDGQHYYILDTIVGYHRTDPPDNLWVEGPSSEVSLDLVGANDARFNGVTAPPAGLVTYDGAGNTPQILGAHVFTLKLRGLGLSSFEIDGSVVFTYSSADLPTSNKILVNAIRQWGSGSYRGAGTYGRGHILASATEAEATASVNALKTWAGVA